MVSVKAFFSYTWISFGLGALVYAGKGYSEPRKIYLDILNIKVSLGNIVIWCPQIGEKCL